MGNVYATVELANDYDLDEVELGRRAADDVRALTLSEALLDTGASHLYLPAPMIEHLGLRVLREVVIETAAGPARTRMYRGLRIKIGGRETVMPCVELPGGTQPLIGVQVMEGLGIIPDVVHHTVMYAPEDSGGTSHFTAYTGDWQSKA